MEVLREVKPEDGGAEVFLIRKTEGSEVIVELLLTRADITSQSKSY